MPQEANHPWQYMLNSLIRLQPLRNLTMLLFKSNQAVLHANQAKTKVRREPSSV